ncbi:DEAD/DEAH box helicase [Salipiger bermudensis]|uniref:DEAD/DEAH box helicase n=1 Tax=Salipiger bermudensis TaxID=344736 RepID=UPI000C8FAF9F|nr:DEAD/DEAH box helicase [Salipiger bermudensis]MAE88407.1 DEAD/DEAH box helicase [Pelagibaca sp.]MBN9677060.1 DEAD/DEAH box helicase [Salipiger bermudensis]
MFDFDMLGLAPTLSEALKRNGFSEPTPIQNQAIPLALEGHDVLGLAQTGTGKTLAFGLPLIDGLLAQPGKPAPKTVKALVLAPTRELVNQIADSLRQLTDGTKLRVGTVVGGQSINRQINFLSRGTDILVATPGRLIDLMDRKAVDLSTVRQLVLDEADQMLDMGFIHALRRIAPQLGTPRQTMLFSATMPKQMEELSSAYLTNPRRVQVSPPGKAADKITQSVHFVDKAGKPSKLREVLGRDDESLTLVFARTKHGAERLMKGLVADGYNAASIHGNKSQGQRDRAIKAFRDGDINVLVATDVAARGIDIPGVAYVVNYDLPEVPDNYVHRIGRTARAGREGEAIAFCAPDEADLLRQIQKLMKIDIPVASGDAPTELTEGGPRRRRGGGGGGGGRGRGGFGGGKPQGAGKPGGGQGQRRRRPRRRAA